MSDNNIFIGTVNGKVLIQQDATNSCQSNCENEIGEITSALMKLLEDRDAVRAEFHEKTESLYGAVKDLAEAGRHDGKTGKVKGILHSIRDIAIGASSGVIAQAILHLLPI